MSYFIIIRGPLGCGKTTISKKLSEELIAEYFAIDGIIDDITKEWEMGMISQKTFLKANEIIVPAAKNFLDQGKPVIFDGNFYWQSQIEDLIKRLKFPYYVFTLQAPLEVCIERDRKRDNPHGKDAARVVYEKSIEFDYGVTIDATQPPESIIQEIILHLSIK